MCFPGPLWNHLLCPNLDQLPHLVSVAKHPTSPRHKQALPLLCTRHLNNQLSWTLLLPPSLGVPRRWKGRCKSQATKAKTAAPAIRQHCWPGSSPACESCFIYATIVFYRRLRFKAVLRPCPRPHGKSQTQISVGRLKLKTL